MVSEQIIVAYKGSFGISLESEVYGPVYGLANKCDEQTRYVLAPSSWSNIGTRSIKIESVANNIEL